MYASRQIIMHYLDISLSSSWCRELPAIATCGVHISRMQAGDQKSGGWKLQHAKGRLSLYTGLPLTPWSELLDTLQWQACHGFNANHVREVQTHVVNHKIDSRQWWEPIPTKWVFTWQCLWLCLWQTARSLYCTKVVWNLLVSQVERSAFSA